MIKVQSLHIENFRGIKSLQLTFNGENLAVKGANGSGKSGVIDAVEFGLTGNITRLTGVGSSGVTVKSHAPHVDCKDNPEKAKVVLNLSLPTGTKFSIERNVATASRPTLTPDTEETKKALTYIQSHPEFSLSRKEILKFVLTEPGKRAKEVQSLLKLDAIDKNRAVLQTNANTASKEEKNAKINFDKSVTDLLSHLKISELSKELVLNAANERRTLLGLSNLADLTPDVKLSEGIASDPKDPKKSIPRADAITKLQNVMKFLEGKTVPISEQVKKAEEAIKILQTNPAVLKSLARQNLFESGVPLVGGDDCPLCDLEWEQEELIKHLKEKIEKNKAAAITKSIIETGVSQRSTTIRALGTELEQFSKYATLLGLDAENKTLLEDVRKLQEIETKLGRAIENLELSETALKTPHAIADLSALSALKNVLAAIEKLPDVSAEEAAKQYLVIADERLANYRKVKSAHDLSTKNEAISLTILKHFVDASETKLSNLYDQVQNDFARFYRELNKEDEANFSALLKPNQGVLNFEVDFYGRGPFPPNAYHSEGHQDSMGLCLYFALSKKLLGNSFSICLLDDVLMSVDSGHRREVCKLLKTEFPNTQFILTTHDEVWSKQLTLEGLIKGKNLLQFRKWTVNDGPAAWDFTEVWTEIESDLKNGRVSDASAGLRRYLEFLMSELAFKLRASTEARPSSNYDLGELMPAVASRIKGLLKKANDAANSWNQKDIVEKVSALSSDFGAKYTATNAEQWAVNATVHYNEWADLSPEDFSKVLETFKSWIATLQCVGCKSWLYVSPIKGQPDTIRCDCGTINFNLKSKQ